MGKFEYWTTAYGKVAESEINPCGCCLDTYTLVEQGPRDKVPSITFIGYYTRSEFLHLMKSLGYKKLWEIETDY